MPVVQTGPFDCLLRNVKAQGADQMQAGTGGSAGAGNVASVLRDLRFDQYDIQHSAHLKRSITGKAFPQACLLLLYSKFPVKSMKNFQNGIDFPTIHIKCPI